MAVHYKQDMLGDCCCSEFSLFKLYLEGLVEITHISIFVFFFIKLENFCKI